MRAVGGEPETPADPGDAPSVASEADIERLLESVQVYVRSGERSKAHTILESAVGQYPDDQDLRLAYGDLLMQDERWGEAFAQYDAAALSGPITAQEHFTAGTLASTVDRHEDAARHYDMAQRSDAANADYPLYLAQTQLKLGLKSEATASLVRASVLNEGNALIWGSMANIALSENKVNMALQHIARARELEPESRDWRLIEAKAMKRAGKAEDAIGVLLGLGDALMTDDEAMRAMSECHGMLGEPEESLALYEQAMALRPASSSLVYQAAVWAERSERTERALELARRAVSMGHEHAGRLVERLEGVVRAVAAQHEHQREPRDEDHAQQRDDQQQVEAVADHPRVGRSRELEHGHHAGSLPAPVGLGAAVWRRGGRRRNTEGDARERDLRPLADHPRVVPRGSEEFEQFVV
eukprot:g5751.t1